MKRNVCIWIGEKKWEFKKNKPNHKAINSVARRVGEASKVSSCSWTSQFWVNTVLSNADLVILKFQWIIFSVTDIFILRLHEMWIEEQLESLFSGNYKSWVGFKWRKLKRADGLKRCYSKWSFEEHTPEAVTDHIDLTGFFILVFLHQYRFLVLMSSSSSFLKAKGFSILQCTKNKQKGHFV